MQTDGRENRPILRCPLLRFREGVRQGRVLIYHSSGAVCFSGISIFSIAAGSTYDISPETTRRRPENLAGCEVTVPNCKVTIPTLVRKDNEIIVKKDHASIWLRLSQLLHGIQGA